VDLARDCSDFKTIADEIVHAGIALVDMSPVLRSDYEKLFAEGGHFFARPLQEKLECAPAPGNNVGFRPVGQEYSIAPSIPDIKESLTFLPAEANDVTAHPQFVRDLYETMSRAVTELDRLCGGIMNVLAARYERTDPIYAAAHSQLAINYYPSDRANSNILIEPHEDGCLLTVLSATHSGLEIQHRDGIFRACDAVVGGLAILPGVSMTHATGGGIEPTLHRVVRRPGVMKRLAIAYDATTDLRHPVSPWVTREGFPQRLDLEAQLTLTRFGLPPLGS
jgi:isopenicillin N synthase-like dioxygenase